MCRYARDCGGGLNCKRIKDKDKGHSELNHISPASWISDVDLTNCMLSANERQRVMRLLTVAKQKVVLVVL